MYVSRLQVKLRSRVSVALLLVAFVPVACQAGRISESSSITQSPPIAAPGTWPPGSLLKSHEGELYRLMGDNTLRQISDAATLSALGYEMNDVAPASQSQLSAYRLGPPLTRWMVSQLDSQVYFLQAGKRHRVPDGNTLQAMGGSLLDVTLVSDQYLASFPSVPGSLPKRSPPVDEQTYPEATAVLWSQGKLWTANQSGLLTRWDIKSQNYEQYRLPGEPIIHALTSDGQAIYAGTETGDIWRIEGDAPPRQIVAGSSGWISDLAIDSNQKLWYAATSHVGRTDFRYHIGQGLNHLDSQDVLASVSDGQTPGHLDIGSPDGDALHYVTALAFDPVSSVLWIGTRFAGLFGYDSAENKWQHYASFNSELTNNTIYDLKLAPDGSLWLATATSLSVYRKGVWENHPLPRSSEMRGEVSLAIAKDNTAWVAGDGYLASLVPGQAWRMYQVTDNPLLSDRCHLVVLDDGDHPWFIGRRGKIHFDGLAWIAYDADVRHFAAFSPMPPLQDITPPPLEFPSPAHSYLDWIQTWPRPTGDNGRGIHFLQTHQFDPIEAQNQVERMKQLGMRWTLVHYLNHDQLVRIAPIFQEAGITVVWRPFTRPYETYNGWAEDVTYLRSRGLAPYMQLYNEPSLAQEWEDAYPIDQELYLNNLLSAAQSVYDAGGYVGLQFVDPGWLHLALQAMRAHGLSRIVDRLFFVPHLYGLNHPPEYEEDRNGVLGFQVFAQVFQEEISFVPIMIVGEGGWRLGEAQDNRYPAIDEVLHRDYHLSVFNWFRSGQLSNGQSLPDYLFAFCPWLISDPHDPAAWFDSEAGERELTVQAIQAMSPFERKFSWDR
jgi:streptogramin lyase